MIALRRYREREPGLADLLNFAALVEEGVVLGKDGSLMAGWFYAGSDVASTTDEELNATSARVNAALARLGSGWMTHHDAIRLEARNYPDDSESFFPDPVSRMIDAERRQQFRAEGEHYETVYALVVTFLPPPVATQKLGTLMFDDDAKPHGQAAGLSVLREFQTKIAEIEDALSSVVALERMGAASWSDQRGRRHLTDALLRYLNFTVTGENHPIEVPPCAMYLDSVIGGKDLWTGVTPKVGDKFIAVVSIDGFPIDSVPAILSGLDQIPTAYRWSTRFVYLDPEEAKTHLGRYRRKWAQKTRGFVDQIMRTNRSGTDPDASAMVTETESALGDANSQLVTFGYFTSVVVVMTDNRPALEMTGREIRRVLQNLGFSCRIETVNTMEAWLGSLPGHALPNLRRPLLHTMQLADLLPTWGIWAGRDECPCPLYPAGSPPLLHAATEGSTPFRLNLHVGDLGHTLVFGPTGSGKSTLIGLIVAQFRRYRDACVFAFDKGNSLFALTHACGGQHFELGSATDGCALAPLAEIDNDAEQAWAEEWIESCAGLQLGETRITPLQRNALHQAMTLLRAAPRDARTITNFITNLQNAELRAALEAYSISGPAGDLLDQERSTIGHGSFQVFEIEELMNRGPKVVVPVLLYLFRRIERQLKGQPALLVLDEAWLMLAHPVFREKIREWLKVLRKANCAVLLATQSLSDAVRSGILDVLLESCPTKILLPNAEALSGSDAAGSSRALYEAIGLNPRQLELIGTATPKRHYYFLSPEGRRLIDLKLGPVTRAFVASSSKEQISRVRELRERYGSEWPDEWLRINRIEPGKENERSVLAR